MQSDREQFWNHASFAVVGDSAGRRFPKLTFESLKKNGKTVYAIDPGGAPVDGQKTYPDFASLPAPVEAAVLELPKAKTAEWVGKAAEAGIKGVWIHQQTDTPEALALAREQGLEVCSGTCAVMYVKPGISTHALHRGIMKLLKKY
jgi:uncharacterized protein